MDSSIFKAYDVRGVYPGQIDEDTAWKIGYAGAKFLLSRAREQHSNVKQSICAGYDMRRDGNLLANAMIKGMNAAGADVIDIGMIDTPQMYFAVNFFGNCGGVQVTASHNPAQYNGFKISGIEAKPVGADTGLTDIKDMAMSLQGEEGKGGGLVERFDLTPEYTKHIRKFLAPMVKGLKIAVDASNGMAGKFVPLIFDDVPIEIIPLNFTHDGTFNHDPNPLVEENLRQIKDAVKQTGAIAGFCFDGDADRLMLVDENGINVPADLMVAMMVPYFLANEPKGTTVIYDLRSSRVVREEIEKYGGTPSRNRVGHVFMKKALRETNGVFGGELSGHFYYRDNFYADSGLITFTQMLNILFAAGKPVSEIVKPLRRYFSSGEMNFKVDDKQTMMKGLANKYKDGQIDYLDGVTVQFEDWWFNCRPSNTEPLLRLNVEARTKELLESKLIEFKTILGEPIHGH
ncbi:MAG: hypothetical protein A2Y07_07120 [Planctomycetes bacterium GWF2_50_10]|nr:MAG: hypothetical protein A2Y07_07120 [Planctomycetes bacterium GWF2_50_10]